MARFARWTNLSRDDVPPAADGSGRRLPAPDLDARPRAARSPATPPSAPRMPGWRRAECRARRRARPGVRGRAWSGSGGTSGWPSRRLRCCVPGPVDDRRPGPDRHGAAPRRRRPRRPGVGRQRPRLGRVPPRVGGGGAGLPARPGRLRRPRGRHRRAVRRPRARREPTSRCGRSCRRWASARTRSPAASTPASRSGWPATASRRRTSPRRGPSSDAGAGSTSSGRGTRSGSVATRSPPSPATSGSRAGGRA